MQRPPSSAPEAPLLTLAQVAKLVGGEVQGDASLEVGGISPLDQAEAHELGFLAQRRYLKYLAGSRARAVLVSAALAPEAGGFQGRVIVEEAHRALPMLLDVFYPPRARDPGIHPTAVLGRGVELGADVRIGPFAVLEEGVVVGDGAEIGAHCVLGRGAVVGEGTVLHPQVVLYPGARVGAQVILHAGVRLGVDGFGYLPGPRGPIKLPQVGGCVVEDRVEMGANCCVDRGSIGRSVVGQDSKLDNLVHLAHNVQLGRGVLMTAQVGVAGSTRVGDGVMFGGQSGVGGHLVIGAGVQVGAQAGVIRDVPAGETVSGFPARNHREWLQAMGMLFRLPETLRRMAALEKRIEELEKGSGG